MSDETPRIPREAARETELRNNADQIVAAIDRIRERVATSPLEVVSKGTDFEYVLQSGYIETIGPFGEKVKNHSKTQLILGYGLTRSGKTLSMVEVFKEMNRAKEGSAVFLDIQGMMGEDPLKSSTYNIEGSVNKTGVQPSLVIIDEAGIILTTEDAEGAAGFLAGLADKFPATTITTIDVFRRNRGRSVDSDRGINPEDKYKPIKEKLRAQGWEAVTHAHRDGWLQTSIETLVVALHPNQQEIQSNPELLKELCLELGAFCMGNPYVLKQIIDNLYTEQEIVDPSKIKELLVNANKQIYSKPNFFEEAQSVYNRVGLGRIGDAFKFAFGGYTNDDLLAKLRFGSLNVTQAAREKGIDWASWGRFTD